MNNVSIHDKFQSEIKYIFKINPKDRKTKYTVESYFFFPKNLGINNTTYTKETFYKDILYYIRLKTPSIMLHHLATDSCGYMRNLKNLAEQLLIKPEKRNRKLFEYEIKMYICMCKSALRDQCRKICIPKNDKKLYKKIYNYYVDVQNIIQQFRYLNSIINQPFTSKKIISIYHCADEYLDLLAELNICKILDYLRTQKCRETASHTAYLTNFIKKETVYRKKQGYNSIPNVGNKHSDMIFNFGILKKYICSVLFLNLELKNNSILFNQIIFALAAGIAMLFATGMAFFGQYTFGNYTAQLFLLLIISYIFKDRIKDLVRIYLNSKTGKYFSDYKLNIYDDSGINVGHSKLNFLSIKNDNVPDDIRQLRITSTNNNHDIVPVYEKIFLFRKKIALYSKCMHRLSSKYQTKAVIDILRLNFKNFTSKMSNSKKKIYRIHNNTITSETGENIYLMHMIVKYIKKTRITYQKYSIYFNRNGIKKILTF